MNAMPSQAPYLAYVRKLCQGAALHPEELVEILRELDGEDVHSYRRRLLEAAEPWTQRFGAYAHSPVAPVTSLSALLSRAYVAGICAVDDLAPDALERQVRRLIVDGYTHGWPRPAATNDQVMQMIHHIEEHTRLVKACKRPRGMS